jgi:hypothetical protein
MNFQAYWQLHKSNVKFCENQMAGDGGRSRVLQFTSGMLKVGVQLLLVQKSPVHDLRIVN